MGLLDDPSHHVTRAVFPVAAAAPARFARRVIAKY
jgi:hypothetical protein